jgi:hypothetical protein
MELEILIGAYGEKIPACKTSSCEMPLVGDN